MGRNPVEGGRYGVEVVAPDALGTLRTSGARTTMRPRLRSRRGAVPSPDVPQQPSRRVRSEPVADREPHADVRFASRSWRGRAGCGKPMTTGGTGIRRVDAPFTRDATGGAFDAVTAAPTDVGVPVARIGMVHARVHREAGDAPGSPTVSPSPREPERACGRPITRPASRGGRARHTPHRHRDREHVVPRAEPHSMIGTDVALPCRQGCGTGGRRVGRSRTRVVASCTAPRSSARWPSSAASTSIDAASDGCA